MNKFFLLLLLPFATLAQEKDYKAESAKIFENIRMGKYAEASANFDTSVSNRIDTAKLRKVWENLLKLTGPFKEVIEVKTDHQPNYDVVIQHSQFEKKKIDFKLVFGTNQKIKGLSFLPGEPKEQYKLPPYNNSDAITERNVIVQNGPYRLPGILTTPKKPGKFPLVILVHGSGPNDKDETVGPTKIFKDIAIGLAMKGIAVYRYDKRTRIYAAKVNKDKFMTVKEETIEDAVAAYNLLKTDSMVDSTAIYYAGHSLGAMLLPRIIETLPGVKGLIFMTANGRPLADMLFEQTQYVMSLDTSGKDKTALLDSVKKEVTMIKSLKKSDTDTAYYFRLPASYWADLNNFDHVAMTKSIKKPMIFLNGGRDYQVTEKDFNIWKQALPNAQFKMYPDLNHFFIKGTGKSTPMEYNKQGNVDEVVITDIAGFILKK